MEPRHDTTIPASAAAMLTPWAQPTGAPTRPPRRTPHEITTLRRTGFARS